MGKYKIAGERECIIDGELNSVFFASPKAKERFDILFNSHFSPLERESGEREGEREKERERKGKFFPFLFLYSVVFI